MGTNISIGNYINRGRLKNKSFHKSLVDYWNFAGKKNSDTDRTTIKGIKGNILNAYNFNWSLGSGYGLYKTNFLQWDYISSRGTATVTSDTIHLTETFGNANVVELNKLAYNPENITVDVTGDFGGVNLIYIYYVSETELAQVLIKTPGRYELPKSNRVNSGFKTNKATKLDLTIKQVPEYEGAIVTDGVDDYLKLDKVGYKIGTVIVKTNALTVGESNYVFDAERERTFYRYLNNGTYVYTSSSFKTKNTYGDYVVLRYDSSTPFNIYTSMFIGCRFNRTEYISMTLYDIAIYQDILTQEEILEEIDKMNKYKLIADYVFNKNNNDADRDYVVNQLNSDERISLLNFNYALGSGYGLYSNNFNDWTVQYGSINTKNSSFVEVDNINGTTKSGAWLDIRNVAEGSIHTHVPFKVRISGADGATFEFKYRSLKDGKNIWIKSQVGDGVWEIPEASGVYPDESKVKLSLYSFVFPLDKKIKVEEIPEYPNHLVFDGVDDYTDIIPNLNMEQGTVLIQSEQIAFSVPKFMSYDEGVDNNKFQNTFFIGSNTVQCRKLDADSRVEIDYSLGSNITAFAYDSIGINIFNNGTFKTSNYINKHTKYQFGKDTNSANYSKIALKRVKIFDKKLTENQIREEYNKLLNE